MKPSLLLKIAAGLILFFAAGHSVGHFTRKSTDDPQGREVLRLMEEYKFPIGSQFRSYDEFYEGMSLILIVTLMTFTVVLWMLAGISKDHQGIASRLLWPLFCCITGFSILCFVYFFMVPAITCLLAAGLIFASIFLLRRETR